ncbi:unnamed protein product [Acanthosepion pharaonis]|uniref:Uncharacterized protein n=1 Tax=Acanthosepion pharaonis TaxID=158019 RepID=A0A812BEH6_ACAPH|nr:unnamed protein product [Sepia pharaonis]
MFSVICSALHPFTPTPLFSVITSPNAHRISTSLIQPHIFSVIRTSSITSPTPTASVHPLCQPHIFSVIRTSYNITNAHRISTSLTPTPYVQRYQDFPITSPTPTASVHPLCQPHMFSVIRISPITRYQYIPPTPYIQDRISHHKPISTSMVPTVSGLHPTASVHPFTPTPYISKNHQRPPHQYITYPPICPA